MGQTVYVLMSLEGGKKGKEWRPNAVVTDASVAEQWQRYGKEVDWVPLELDDTRYLQPGEKQPEFHPHQMTPIEQRAIETAKRLEETNEGLMKVIQDLQKQVAKLSKRPRASLLKRATVPPKPAGFADVLNDSQEIADYVETWATDYVDNELVYEKYRGMHAVLKLIPVDQLQEGGRAHNMQNPANEKKYQRMGVKTIPPLLVEDGKIEDGNHRFRAGVKRGLTAMWCYVVIRGRSS